MLLLISISTLCFLAVDFLFPNMLTRFQAARAQAQAKSATALPSTQKKNGM